MLGNRYLQPLIIIYQFWLSLISSRMVHVTATRVIHVDNPGKLTLGGLFVLTEINEKSKCIDRFSLDGLRSLLAMQFAVERINYDDTILPNITLGIKAFDTCFSRVPALEYTLKHFVLGDHKGNLSQYPIVGLIGPALSYEAVYISKVLGVFEIPVISYSATSYELNDKTHYPYFSRTIPSDLSQAQAMVELLQYFNWTYVSAVYTDDSYGVHGIKLLKSEAKKRGICFATEIQLPVIYNEAMYREKIGQLANRNSTDVIVLFCIGAAIMPTINIMADMMKNFEQTQLFGSEAMGNSWLLDNIVQVKTGFVYTRLVSNNISDYQNYLENLSVEKMNSKMSPWFKLAYEQIMNCTFNNGTNNMQICNSSQTLGNALSPGYSFYVSDRVIDAVYVFAHGLHQVLKASCPSLSNCEQTTKISGSLLLDTIRNSSFPSVDGRRIDINSKGEVKGGYSLHYVIPGNKIGTWQTINIGSWQGRLKMNSSSISNSGLKSIYVKAQCSEPCKDNQIKQRIPEKPVCCWTCVECPANSIAIDETTCYACGQGYLANKQTRRCIKIQEIFYSLDKRISKLLVIPPLVLSVLGMVCLLFTLCIFIKFNANPLVKASGRELCYLLLTGLLLSFLFPMACIFRPSRFKCLSQFVLDSLPLTISLVPIVMKTNRVVRIFDPTRRITDQPSFARPLYQIILSALLISIQIVLLFALFIMQFPKEKIVYFSSTEVHLVCSTTQTQILFAHAYNVILIIICTYYGFRVRNAPSNFNEAKCIAFAMYASCVIIVVFFVIFVIAATGSSNEILQQAIQSYRVVLLANVILFCFFAPKVYIILFQRGRIKAHQFSFNEQSTIVCNNSQADEVRVRTSVMTVCKATQTEQRSQISNEMTHTRLRKNRQDRKRWTF